MALSVCTVPWYTIRPLHRCYLLPPELQVNASIWFYFDTSLCHVVRSCPLLCFSINVPSRPALLGIQLLIADSYPTALVFSSPNVNVDSVSFQNQLMKLTITILHSICRKLCIVCYHNFVTGHRVVPKLYTSKSVSSVVSFTSNCLNYKIPSLALPCLYHQIAASEGTSVTH